MSKKKTKKDSLDEAAVLARKNGMTYAQFQRLETKGLAKIVNGKLLLKGRDY